LAFGATGHWPIGSMMRDSHVKELHLFHPPCEVPYIHIDLMFSTPSGVVLDKLGLLIAHVLGTALRLIMCIGWLK
jgi:hypothetical protein